MAALATTTDVEAVIGRELTGAETPRVERLLEFASAAVRTYIGQVFDRVIEDAHTFSGPGVYRRLPQRPVVEVVSVVDNGTAIGSDLYSVNVDTGVLVRRRFDEWSAWTVPSVWVGPTVVTYTHGYLNIPADVVGVVAEAAARKFQNPAGVKQQSLGGWSETTSTVVDGVQLTPSEMASLAPYRSVAGPIPLSY